MKSVDFAKHFEYCEMSPTGLVWKHFNGSRNPNFIRNKGDIAGHLHSYPTGKPKSADVGLCGQQYKCHHIVWLLHGRTLSKDLVIDHIDGNPWNNSIENLRLVTENINRRNSAKSSNCKTNITGVSIGRKIRENKIDHYLVVSYTDHNRNGKYVRKHFNLNRFENDEFALEFGELFMSYIMDDQIRLHGYSERHGK